MPPNDLNNTDLPSMTGMASSAPILPRLSTRDPLHTMARLFHFEVYSYARPLLLAISAATNDTFAI